MGEAKGSLVVRRCRTRSPESGPSSQPENKRQIHPAGTLKRSHRASFCCLHCGFGLQVVQVAIHSCYGQDAPAAAVL
jgi:hypothetical protein